VFWSAFSDEVVWSCSEGAIRRGLAPTHRPLQSDVQAIGVKHHPTNVLAGEGIIVIEGDFESPPEDSLHCPPSDSVVVFYHCGRIRRAHQYYPLRPKRDEEAAHGAAASRGRSAKASVTMLEIVGVAQEDDA